MALLDLGRVVQHIREGGQKPNRISIGQYKIHATTPHGAEGPFVLRRRKEALAVDLQHASHVCSTYILEGAFVEREKMSILHKHSHD